MQFESIQQIFMLPIIYYAVFTPQVTLCKFLLLDVYLVWPIVILEVTFPVFVNLYLSQSF